MKDIMKVGTLTMQGHRNTPILRSTPLPHIFYTDPFRASSKTFSVHRTHCFYRLFVGSDAGSSTASWQKEATVLENACG